jgi:hypothetical protein
MLAGRANEYFELRARLSHQNDWSHFDGLRPSAEDKHDAQTMRRKHGVFGGVGLEELFGSEKSPFGFMLN